MSSVSISAKNRLDFLDSARGLAAILVLLQHSLEAAGYFAVGYNSFSNTWLSLGQTGVMAFFLVSGFVIPISLEKHGDGKDFWIKRAARIYPLYWAIFFFTIFVRVTFLNENFPNLLTSIPLHIFFAQNYVHVQNYVGGSWTLSIELLWYIGFFSAFFLGLSKKTNIFFGLAILAALAIGLIAIFAPIRLPTGRMNFLFLCCLGLLFLRNFEGAVTGWRFGTIAGLLIMSMTLGLIGGFYIHPDEGDGAFHITAVLLSWGTGISIFALFYFFRHTKIVGLKPLTYLGKISYSVYLVHSPLLLVFESMHITGLPIIVLTIGCTIVLSHLTFNYIEQPFVRLARSYGRSAPSAQRA